MTASTLILVTIAAAAGTFLIRLLPMLWHTKGTGKSRGRPLLRNALEAIGPSAIVALLAVSLWELVLPAPATGLPVAVGLGGVLLGKKVFGSIAWATLAGVAAYGTTLWLQAVSL